MIEEFLNGFIKISPHKEHKDFYKFILNGTKFTGRINSQILGKLPITPKIKECYYNSQMIAMSDESLKYYEGYYYDSIIPVEHGWLVKDGKVIDVTLEVRDKKFKKDLSKGGMYLGIEIPTLYLAEHIKKTGMAENLLYRYWREEIENGKRRRD